MQALALWWRRAPRERPTTLASMASGQSRFAEGSYKYKNQNKPINEAKRKLIAGREALAAGKCPRPGWTASKIWLDQGTTGLLEVETPLTGGLPEAAGK